MSEVSTKQSRRRARRRAKRTASEKSDYWKRQDIYHHPFDVMTQETLHREKQFRIWLPCSHHLSLDDYSQWLLRGKTNCPVCRAPMFEGDAKIVQIYPTCTKKTHS